MLEKDQGVEGKIEIVIRCTVTPGYKHRPQNDTVCKTLPELPFCACLYDFMLRCATLIAKCIIFRTVYTIYIYVVGDRPFNCPAKYD